VSGAIVVGAPARGFILNDDSPVTVTATSGETREGDDGQKTIALDVRLSAPRGVPVTVDYATSDVTATTPGDYEGRSGTLTFAPGAVAISAPIPVHGDRSPEFDEAFALSLSNPVNATIDQPARAAGTLLNDDAIERPGLAISHGARQEGDLTTPATYHVVQDPLASYEALAEAGGSVWSRRLLRYRPIPPFPGLGQLMGWAHGRVPSLRWFNSTSMSVEDELVRVSTLFGDPGLPHDTYRLRFYETTLAGPRFNNSSQSTTLIVQNAGSDPVTGEIHFFDDNGIPRHTEPFAVAARGSFVKALADIPALAGIVGSLTVAHDGRYGTVVGKAVSFEVATGLCFDHLLVTRPR
ncbi:MAG TPA: Calx-beta domain-containing protein, partial [Vicinamibacteria bacterium]|nr:Calx-beta domain-containing protein [Vicinamibacteria bacterium]